MKKDKPIGVANEPTEVSETAATINQEEEGKEKYHMENADKYPNRLISYVKVKILNTNNQPYYNVKGTGCLISNQYLLTAAHNLQKGIQLMAILDNNKFPFENRSLVRQGMGLMSEKKCICEYSIQKCFINPRYGIKQKQEIAYTRDFALAEIIPKGEAVKEDKYMPIVLLNEQSLKNIKRLFISGYPVVFSQGKSKDQSSSVYMHFQYSSSSAVKSFEKYSINYSYATQGGISGAPIIAEFQNQFIIIGIHKGVKGTQGIGVGAGDMIEVLNNFGYDLQKKPFVFTERTLNLRGKEKDVSQRQILFLMDRNLSDYDMLVYTAFDLQNVKKIILSGNQIGKNGVRILLQRKYPNIKSLFLTDNRIDTLDEIDEENWKNVQTLATLGLNANQLKNLPKGILHLKSLSKLWVAYNQIKTVPTVLHAFCTQNNRQILSIYLYQNQINFENQRKLIEQINKLKTRVIWSREGNELKQQN